MARRGQTGGGSSKIYPGWFCLKGFSELELKHPGLILYTCILLGCAPSRIPHWDSFSSGLLVEFLVFGSLSRLLPRPHGMGQTPSCWQIL